MKRKRKKELSRGQVRWNREQWEQATLDLLRRDGDTCLWCGKALRGHAERHHRQRRGVGGDHLANLVLLHSRCHQTAHSQPEQARRRGVIVPTWDDFTTRPLTLKDGRTFRLLPDGTRLAVDSRDESPALGEPV